MNAYNISSLGFYRCGRPIMEQASLDIPAGGITAVIGPNGTGKSTFLRLLAGLEQPGQGEIVLLGEKLFTLQPGRRARMVAYLAQNNAQDLPFSAEQTIMLGRAPWQNALGLENEADRFITKKVMEELDLVEFGNRPVRELSGGEAQRVFIARAVCQDTPVLLLDEPTAALDYRHQATIMEVLVRLRERGKTVIMAVHDLNLASMYVDYIISLHGARLTGPDTSQKAFRSDALGYIYDSGFFVDAHPQTKTPRITLLKGTGQESSQ